jgi:hypothetical protein
MYTNEERKLATLEDIITAESLAELEALWVNGVEEEADEDVVKAFEAACVKFMVPQVEEPKPVEVAKPDYKDLIAKGDLAMAVEELLKKVNELESSKEKVVKLETAPAGAPRLIRYRLMHTRLDWATAHQVHAIVHILINALALKPGDTFTNDEAIAALEANADLLNTRQPVKKVWDFYKGASEKGLLAHGNIEKA